MSRRAVQPQAVRPAPPIPPATPQMLELGRRLGRLMVALEDRRAAEGHRPAGKPEDR